MAQHHVDAASAGIDSRDRLLTLPVTVIADELKTQLADHDFTGSGAGRGLIVSYRTGVHQVNFNGYGPYTPGVDAPQALDLVQTAAHDGRPMAAKYGQRRTVQGLHVVADVPARLDNLTGDFDPMGIVRFTLAAAYKAGLQGAAHSRIYMNDGVDNGLVYEGSPQDSDYGMSRVERDVSNRFISVRTRKAGLIGLLDMVKDEANPNEDAVLVVSDFQDTLGAEEGWDASFRQLADEMGSRLLAVCIDSPAQEQLPFGVGPLSMDSVMAIAGQEDVVVAAAQEARDKALNHTNHVRISTVRDADEGHPTTRIIDFLTEGAEQS